MNKVKQTIKALRKCEKNRPVFNDKNELVEFHFGQLIHFDLGYSWGSSSPLQLGVKSLIQYLSSCRIDTKPFLGEKQPVKYRTVVDIEKYHELQDFIFELIYRKTPPIEMNNILFGDHDEPEEKYIQIQLLEAYNRRKRNG
jgi:hypothetical protein